MIKTKKWWLTVMLLGSILFYSFEDDLFLISKNLDIFASIYKELNLSYVDELNSSQLVKTGINAMLESLDPYTEYIPESDVEDYKMKYVNTQYGGIGASVFYKNDKVYISDVYEGYPAQKSDMRPGDEIVSINNISLNKKNNEQVSLLLKGPRETPVKVMISRNGKVIEKNIFRAEIRQPNVTYTGMLDNNVGYIKLDKFLENASTEVRQALLEIKKQNPKGVILDLRFNGGGIVQEAIKIVNLFVDKNLTIVEQRGRNKEKDITYRTFENPIDNSIPLIVLINGRSASASEIVAGSLQDLDRAVIVGQQSFGKGLVQQTVNLPYNSLVKITVAKYYTPSGRCLQALDYTHRNQEGAVNKISDSLRRQFKTKNNRLVFDGSGVYPDVMVTPYVYHPITKSLLMKYLFLDYASLYVDTHPSISSAKAFNLNDNEYLDFLRFLENKDYSYQTESEELLKSFADVADDEKTFNDIRSEYNSLKAKIAENKKSDLMRFKPEIKRVLENEIVQRYYFEKGKTEQSFQYDEELKAASNLFNQPFGIDEILKGIGKYKTIGKNESAKKTN